MRGAVGLGTGSGADVESSLDPTCHDTIPTDRAQQWLAWWITSWEPSYREVRLSDLRSVQDLSAIVCDAGVQLGAGEAKDAVVRQHALSSLVRFKDRLRKETSSIIEELLAGWRELGGR